MNCEYLHQQLRAIAAFVELQWRPRRTRAGYTKMAPDQSSSSSMVSSSQDRGDGLLDSRSKGSLPVYVGISRQRFLVPIGYLSCAGMAILLKQSEDEFGFEQSGALTLPCDVEVFETALRQAEESFVREVVKCKQEKKKLSRRMDSIRSVFR